MPTKTPKKTPAKPTPVALCILGLGLQILCGPRFGAAAVETVKESLVETPKIPTPDVVKAPVAAPEEKPAVSKREKYLYAIGRRKTAVAKVRAFPGSAEFQVNKRPFGKYFQTKDLQKTVLSPLSLLGLEKELGFEVFVSGSGIHSQADAVRHAIARLLILRNPEDKRTLKKAGFLTRDPRVKERKKPGLKRARRGPQWAKR